jgi:hypothetical protein
VATIMCDEGDNEPAIFIMTNLQSGDVNSVCAGHFPEFIAELGEALASAMALQLADEALPADADISPPDVPEGAQDAPDDDAGPTPAPKTSGRSRATTSAQPADTADDANSDEIAAPVAAVAK